MSYQDIRRIFAKVSWVDLTHTLNSSIPTWNGNCGFGHEIKMDYEQGCRVQSLRMLAGIGTHLDAPSHFIPYADSAADIAVQNLVAPLSLIDVTARANASYMISKEDIISYEQDFGSIQKNSFVLGYTGWSQYWSIQHNIETQMKMAICDFLDFQLRQ